MEGEAYYEGPFEMGKRHGKDGTLSIGKDYTYTGEFYHGKREGKACEECKAEKYTGDFRNDKRDGFGVLQF